MTSSNGKTTLTKARLLELAKPRFEWVEIEPFGKVGIRSPSELTRSRRIAGMFDNNGKVIQERKERRRIYMLIDQLMVNEDTPMFTEADFEELANLDGMKLDLLMAAVTEFNGESEKNESAGSNDSGNTSGATTV